MGTILLAAAISSPVWAKKGGGGGGGGESQAGGLPALEDRVDTIDMEIATLTTEVGTLTTEVNTLITEVGTLTTNVGELETDVTDLAGQNNWAVINEVVGVASVVRSFSVPGPVTVTQTGVGLAVVNFNKDVSGCAYEATIGGVGTTAPIQGQINVFSDAGSVDKVDVQSFDTTGLKPMDSPFHLTVTCP